MSLTKLSLAGNDLPNQTKLSLAGKLNYSPQGRCWLVTSRLGTGKSQAGTTMWLQQGTTESAQQKNYVVWN
jgi:hypothetical protein